MSNLVAGIYPHPLDVGRCNSSVSVLSFDDETNQILDVFAYEESKCNSEEGFDSGPFPDRSLFLGLKHFGASPSDFEIWVFPTPPGKLTSLNSSFFTNARRFRRAEWARKLGRDVFLSCCKTILSPHLSREHCTLHFPILRGFFCNLDGGGDGGGPTGFNFGSFVAGQGLQVTHSHKPSGP